ncbi:hypothetical protein SAMD00019534_039180, partial [Acytostelium subglobosum LB1]|uniref:hypothetical protein n=1 Tax=Acytostelium subglobosum LB1 TaxID=1410327 RepID=UPI000644C0BF
MAALRVAMGILIMNDLRVRSLYLHDHYTDLGAVPTQVVIDNSAFQWSFYFLNSSFTYTAFLFTINLLSAFSMTIGYRTTLSTFITWAMMLSIHVRNPLVLNGGDDFFRIILFWMMFLPLGAKFSVDSTINVELINKKANVNSPKTVGYSPVISTNPTFPTTDSQGKYFLSFGTIAIMAQFCFMYLFTAYLKTGIEWNSEVFGRVVRAQPRPVCHAHRRPATPLHQDWTAAHIPHMKNKDTWIAYESSHTMERLYGYDAFVKLIKLSPILRILGLFITLGVFKRFYLWLVNRPLFINGQNWSFLTKIYPTKPVQVSRGYVKEICMFMLLIFVLNWNFATVWHYSVPESVRWLGPVFKIDQYWSMFSPYPSKDDGWLVMPGTLVNGSVVDVYRGGGEVDYEKPEMVSKIFPTQRWRKYLMNLEGSGNRDKRLHYGRYLCREWNWYGRHTEEGTQLKSFKIIYMLEMTPSMPKDGVMPIDPKPNPLELWSHQCF